MGGSGGGGGSGYIAWVTTQVVGSVQLEATVAANGRDSSVVRLEGEEVVRAQPGRKGSSQNGGDGWSGGGGWGSSYGGDGGTDGGNGGGGGRGGQGSGFSVADIPVQHFTLK